MMCVSKESAYNIHEQYLLGKEYDEKKPPFFSSKAKTANIFYVSWMLAAAAATTITDKVNKNHRNYTHLYIHSRCQREWVKCSYMCAVRVCNFYIASHILHTYHTYIHTHTAGRLAGKHTGSTYIIHAYTHRTKYRCTHHALRTIHHTYRGR